MFFWSSKSFLLPHTLVGVPNTAAPSLTSQVWHFLQEVNMQAINTIEKTEMIDLIVHGFPKDIKNPRFG